MADIVSSLLRKMIRTLTDSGVFEPDVSAERILSSITGMKRSELYAATDTIIYNPDIHSAKAALERRIAGEPAAYITGECEFFNIKLKIDRRVLVPRPETEILVEETIKLLRQKGGKSKAVDIGTGSGNIAISLVRNISDLEMIATDIGPLVLNLAEENAKLNGVGDRIEFRLGKHFVPITDCPGIFDCVVSNPPYIGEEEKATLPVEVRKYEPPEALFAGKNGFAVSKEIITKSPEYLKPGGFLAMEIGFKQGQEIEKLMRPYFKEVKLLKDLAGRDRVVVGYTG